MDIAFASKKSADKYLPHSSFSVARILGIGSYIAWVFLLFYMTKAYPEEGFELRNILYLNQTFSTMALSVGLIILGIIAAKRSGFTISKGLVITGVIVMIVGSVCIIANRLITLNNVEMIVIIGGLLTGLGSSVILASWGICIVPNTARTRLVECACAFAAALSNCFIFNFLPTSFTLILILATPIISGILAIYCLKRTRPLPLSPPEGGDSTSGKRLAIRACVGALCFGLVAGFMDVLSGYRTFSVGEYYDALLLGIATICAVGILLIALFVKRDALVVCYRVAIFLAILGCMLTPFMSDGNTYPNAIIAGSYIAAQVVVFTLVGTFVKRLGFSPLSCFCAGASALYIGESLGLFACIMLADYIPDSTAIVFAIAVVLAAGLLFSYLFLFTERDFINHNFIYSSLSKNTAGSDALARLATGTQDMSLAFAQEYGLTSREIEVFVLVAQGRSNARIQEELFISSGTVSTHINHIYRKTNVSNKQELLDIIQEWQKENMK